MIDPVLEPYDDWIDDDDEPYDWFDRLIDWLKGLFD